MEVYASYQAIMRALTVFNLVVLMPIFLRVLKLNEV